MQKWLRIIIFLFTCFGSGKLFVQKTIQLDAAVEKKIILPRR